MSDTLRQTPIIILCGGAGTRLKSILGGKPKILASIGDKMLLDITLSMLARAGFEKIILSVGHLKEHIEEYAGEKNYPVVFSREDEPLGTGGALAAALPHTDGAEHFFAMNGDMIFNPDFAALHHFHLKKRALMSMALTRPYGGDGGAVVELDGAGQIVGWRNKKTKDAYDPKVFLNAGVYVFTKEAARHFPSAEYFSLEQDVFPKLFKQSCYGFKTDSYCIDIGTPERYARALTERSDLW